MRSVIAIFLLALGAIWITSTHSRRVVANFVAPQFDDNDTLPLIELGQYSPYGLEFDDSLRRVCYRLGFDLSWAKAVISAESAWNYRATNSIGATGLIQFLPPTLAGLGTTPEAVLAAEPIDQIQLIYRFWLPAKGRINSAADLRLYTFYPAALGLPNEAAIGGAEVALRNGYFDLDKDGTITVGEFRQRVGDASHE